MGQELVVPDWAKNGQAKGFAVLNPQDDSLSEGIGQSYPVIGYKGKVWSFRWRGERKNFIRADDGSPMTYLDVIVLGQAKQKSKSFYKAYDQNSEGDRPICSSIDGVTPDPDVTEKQADACALCPHNVVKTNPQTGRKGRECTDYKRLAVLVLPGLTKALFGDAVMEPAFLRVPPASLNSLAIMGDTMTAQGFHYSSYITRISFDPNEAHPKMVFRPLQGLSDQEAPVILQIRQDAQVDRIIGGGYTTRAISNGNATGLVTTGIVDAVKPTPQTQVLEGTILPPSGAGTKEAGSQEVPPRGNSANNASAPPATTSGLLEAAPSTGIMSPTTATDSGGAMLASDVGAAEATDAELDAQIAALIAPK